MGKFLEFALNLMTWGLMGTALRTAGEAFGGNGAVSAQGPGTPAMGPQTGKLLVTVTRRKGAPHKPGGAGRVAKAGGERSEIFASRRK